MGFQVGNNVRDRRKKTSDRRPYPKRTNVIDPESLTTLEPLANTAFSEVTNAPKDIRPHLPSEAALVTTDTMVGWMSDTIA